MVVFLLVMMLIIPSLVMADAVYKNSRWASKLENGALKVQGSGYGKWGNNWITVNSGVTGYSEVGTSKGPVIIYQKGSTWHAVTLRFDTGYKLNPRNFSQITSIIRGGKYGAIIKSGQDCYDYSWSQLKSAPCR